VGPPMVMLPRIGVGLLWCGCEDSTLLQLLGGSLAASAPLPLPVRRPRIGTETRPTCSPCGTLRERNYARSRQKSLNRVGDSSVYRTVLLMFRCPKKSCNALVSCPSPANLKPQECRSMWA